MQCVICGMRDKLLLEAGIRNDPEGGIWKCLGCGLVFQSPQPDDAELKEYYSGVYRENSRIAYKRFDRGIWEARRRAKMVPLSTGSLLEIGSGAGSFLYIASEEYLWSSVLGVEPDEQSCVFLKKNYSLNVVPEISQVHADEKFDAIVMFHVLEHLADPVVFLSRLKGRLADNGVIVVEVPNAKDAMLWQRVYRKTYFYQKAHLWYFSKRTLRMVFEKADLPVKIKGVQRYNLTSHLRWLFMKRNYGDGNEEDLKQSVFSKVYGAGLKAFGRCDTLWAVSRNGGIE